MDMAKGELRPTFNEDAVKLIEADEDGTAILETDRTSHKLSKDRWLFNFTIYRRQL